MTIKAKILLTFGKITFSTSVSGQVDSHLQITGSILQPVISGNVKLSRGEVYLPQDGGSGDSQALASNQSAVSAGGDSQEFASRYISQYFGSRSASLTTKSSQSSSSGNTLHFNQFRI